jgi:predicted PurR-regulated permease PerM
MVDENTDQPANEDEPRDGDQSRDGDASRDDSASDSTGPFGRQSEPLATTSSTQSDAVEPDVTVMQGGGFAYVDLVPKWITRLLVGIAVTVLSLWAIMWVTRRLRDVIGALLTSLFLAFALEPAVNWLVAKRGWKRSRATLLVILALIVVGIAIVASMVPLLISQVQDLVKASPHLIHTLGGFTERYFHFRLSSHYITQELSKLSSSLTSFAGSFAKSIFGVGVEVIKVILLMLATLLFTYYLIADAPALRRFLLSFMSRQRQEKVLWVWETAIDKTGGYLYSRAILAAISAVLMFAALEILGVPYAIPLALWMGVISQFLPAFGAYVGAVLPLFVTLLQSPLKALILLVYVIVYQVSEDHVIKPPLTARTMSVNGGVAFGAAFAGVALYGIVGALLALPTAAVLQAALTSYVQSRQQEVLEAGLTADVPPPPEVAIPGGRVLLRRIWARIRRAALWCATVLHIWRKQPPGPPDEPSG